VRPGPELAALGVVEVYWQRSKYGGVGGMGIQLRLAAGSKQRMYYFAGGSNGQLPATFQYCGDAIPKGQEYDLRCSASASTLTGWQMRPNAVDELATAILEAIAADRANGVAP
jgi:hypothetical protein